MEKIFTLLQSFYKINNLNIKHVLLISLLTIAVYINIFPNKFVMDDFSVFNNWPAVKNMNIPRLIQGEYPKDFQGKAYRPIKGIIAAIDYKIWGKNETGYHLQSIIVHLLITLTVYLIISKLTNKTIGLISGTLFGIHPLHTEAVTFMTASLDSFGILFFFLSFYLYIKSDKFNKQNMAYSLLLAFLAFFTYELTFSLPILIILYDLCIKKINYKKLIANKFYYLSFILLIGLNILSRYFFLGQIQKGNYIANSFYITFLTEAKAVLKYFELVLWPVNLSVNPTLPGGISSWIKSDLTNFSQYTQQSIFKPETFLPVISIGLLIFISIILFRKKPLISFCILFFFISLIPVLNLIFPQLLVMAERYDYIASFGIILLIGYLIYNLYLYFKKQPIAQNILIILTLILILVFSILTIQRNMDWKNISSIWISLARVNKNTTSENYYLAMVNLEKSDNQNAIYYLNKTISMDPKNLQAYTFLTLAYLNTGDSLNSQRTLEKLKKILNTKNSSTINNLQKAISAYTIQKNVNSQNYSNQIFSINYPQDLQANTNSNGLIISNKAITIKFAVDSVSRDDLQNYIFSQKQYGQLIKEGIAKTPMSEYAYAKYWNDDNLQKMELFLFNKNKIVKILVYPLTSVNQQLFNQVLSSLKFP